MKRPELYKKTCDILYDAYFNDTLEHLNCRACAVSNIVAGYNNQRILPTLGHGYKVKYIDEYTLLGTGIEIHNWYYERYTIAEKNTGYSLEELLLIEKGFEFSKNGDSPDEWMFNGLTAVIEVLNKIHEVEEDNQTQRFEQHYKSKILSNELQ